MAEDLAPVSVVIAAYNAELTLGPALASALAQLPPPAQVIVVDDGSTDGTAAVAASFPGVEVIEQRNQGPSAARNCGIRAASQPWVAFLDADDLWLPGKLARQLAIAHRRPEAARATRRPTRSTSGNAPNTRRFSPRRRRAPCGARRRPSTCMTSTRRTGSGVCCPRRS